VEGSQHWVRCPEDLEEAATICRELGLDDFLRRMPVDYCRWLVKPAGAYLTANAVGSTSPALCFRVPS
jgi:hypothetical protein